MKAIELIKQQAQEIQHLINRYDELKARTQKLLGILESIEHAPVPANEREYISWFITAKNIAGGAISEWNATEEIQSSKEPKEGEEV